MDKRYRPLTPLEQLRLREELNNTIRGHPEWPFDEAIRHVRTTLRLTVEDMAKVARVSAQTLRNIEAGRTSPSVETASKLLRPFGLRLSVTTTQPAPLPPNVALDNRDSHAVPS